jgi:hypothetical protein
LPQPSAAGENEDEEEEPEGWQALPLSEKLQDILGYLRSTYHYCIFCGCQVCALCVNTSCTVRGMWFAAKVHLHMYMFHVEIDLSSFRVKIRVSVFDDTPVSPWVPSTRLAYIRVRHEVLLC